MPQQTENLVGKVILDRQGAPCIEPLWRSSQDMPERMYLESAPADLQAGAYVHAIWRKAHSGWRAHFKETLGLPETLGIESKIAQLKHGIKSEWSAQVCAEANAFADRISDEVCAARTDLRQLPLVTIDDESARDHDDAVYCKPLPSGGWRLWVAIADVSHYVKPDSAIDQSALERGTSVYFPTSVVPMLPERLSTDLCSLKPKVDRLCLVCEIALSDNGACTDYRFYEALMRSRARLTYKGVEAVLFGQGSAGTKSTTSSRRRKPSQDQAALDAQARSDAIHQEFAADLKTLYELYRTLRTAREERGAIDINRSQANSVFNDNGKLIAIRPMPRMEAHKIIEECMIVANICAAKLCDQQSFPCVYRVHEQPPKSDHMELVRALQSQGIRLPEHPHPADYQAAMARINGMKGADMLAMQVLKAMPKANYTVDNDGHFGLALEAYTHFTSPIRRYADLLVHRAIKAANHQAESGRTSRANTKAPDHQPPYQEDQMEQMALAISNAERTADEASRFAEGWLRCVFMRRHLGESFTATVVGVSEFGLFVEIAEPYVQGMVHISDLAREYLKYNARRMCLVGSRTGRSFGSGDVFRVQLVAVDESKGRLKFVTFGLDTSDQPKHLRRPKRKIKKRKRQ